MLKKPYQSPIFCFCIVTVVDIQTFQYAGNTTNSPYYKLYFTKRLKANCEIIFSILTLPLKARDKRTALLPLVWSYNARKETKRKRN